MNTFRNAATASVLALVAVTVPAMAQIDPGYSEAQAEYNEALGRCDFSGPKSGLPGSKVVNCLKMELSKADQELGKIYQGRFSYLPKSEVEGLRDAERAWISFHDKNAPGSIEAKEKSTIGACLSRSYNETLA
jgi:uncharacterized protein YecT (DUF1311 family)